MTVQATLLPPEASKGPSQAGDEGQGVEVAKDKGKGKETKPSSEAKDAAKAKDVAKAMDATTKAKEVKDKSKEVDPKLKDTSASQPTKKENPSPPKAKTLY